MSELSARSVVVTGGNRGLGLAIVEALRAQQARVTVVARDAEQLGRVAERLGVATIRGDVTEEELARRVLAEVRPSVLVLNAGASPTLGPLHEQTWEGFSESWNNDVKAGFHWVQQALRQPLAQGSRVLITSSGAALNGSPLSGGYAGAKRMLWLMAHYANLVSKQLELGISFQVLVPQQIIGQTELGRKAAEAYAKRKGVSPEEFLAGFGAPLLPEALALHVVSILTDPQYRKGVAFGLKGDTGIVSLDA